VTRECLKAIGKLPVESERLIILVIIGTRTEAQSFRREVGIGSSSHCLLGREFRRSDTSASEAGERSGSDDWEAGGEGLREGSESVLISREAWDVCESRRDCSVKRRDEILSEKNEQKVSAIEGDERELGRGEGDLR